MGSPRKSAARPAWLAEMAAQWKAPTPAPTRGEAVLFALLQTVDVVEVTPPPLPHVDRIIHDLTRAGWGTPARPLTKGLVRAGKTQEKAAELVLERLRDGRLVLCAGGRLRWWSDASRREIDTRDQKLS